MGESMYISTNRLAIKQCVKHWLCHRWKIIDVEAARWWTLSLKILWAYHRWKYVYLQGVYQISYVSTSGCLSQVTTYTRLSPPNDELICKDKTLSLSKAKVCTSPKRLAIEVKYKPLSGCQGWQFTHVWPAWWWIYQSRYSELITGESMYIFKAFDN
jgi:hypothetical protein